jgi:sRNA-binding carbon storage regulator CsrA
VLTLHQNNAIVIGEGETQIVITATTFEANRTRIKITANKAIPIARRERQKAAKEKDQ